MMDTDDRVNYTLQTTVDEVLEDYKERKSVVTDPFEERIKSEAVGGEGTTNKKNNQGKNDTAKVTNSTDSLKKVPMTRFNPDYLKDLWTNVREI